MDITNERDARAYVADWHAAATQPNAGMMRVSHAGNAHRIEGLAGDLGTALAIMNAAPHRYGVDERTNMRAAITYLRHGAHPYAQPVTVAGGTQ